ncbi:F-box/SPRY domain-containing protein 1 [Folsomia candida]|uniref:F-box/SPRY domain-containing protein 1 n=1 Tax=Folsomia candida TaxID=158441 RepID=A0A226D4U9_FOLCA|nr:F-box/SPRY domain-containing protein 1 [Folsomia candida]
MPCWPGRNKKKVVGGSAKSSLTLVNETGGGGEAKKSIQFMRSSFLNRYVATHPIETAQVLKEIFSYLPINDILRVRQVCKRWNTSACYVLRRKIEGAIILQRGLSYYTHVMSRSLDIPIGRLFLKIDDMGDPSTTKFFQVVGPSIIFLVLNLEGASLAGFLSQVHHLKNLKQLSLNLFQEEFATAELTSTTYRKRKATSVKIFIDNYSLGEKQGREKLEHLESFVLSCEPDWASNEALLLEKLLELSPHLKNLNLHKWPFMLKPNLFQRCEFKNLKFLSLKSLDDKGFHILGKKQLPNLKTIEFELSRDVTQEYFTTFLENVAPSLEYMEIKSLHNPEIAFKLPTTMKELDTIRLPNWCGTIMLDSICSYAPVLEKLQLSNVNPSDIYVKDSIKTAPTVEYLAINFGSGSHSIKKAFKVLRSLVAAFPNLKTFMMKKVSDKMLEIICEGWPSLEALRITTSFALSDSGITGLPASLLQKTQKTEHRLPCGCGVPFNVVDGKADCAKARVTPHLALLKSKQTQFIAFIHLINNLVNYCFS